MNNTIDIRSATASDAEALLRIYAPYVEHSAVSFELVLPSVYEFRSRITHCLERYPWLVAEYNGEIVGYAYLGQFKERAAYAHSAETSIYVCSDAQGRGIGKRLYSALEDEARRRGILNLYACIAYTDVPNDYLTRQSLVFHSRIGYRQVGVFRKCGCKFGRVWDMAYMEKILAFTQLGDCSAHQNIVK